MIFSKSLYIGILFLLSFSSMNLVYSETKKCQRKHIYSFTHFWRSQIFILKLFHERGPHHIETSLLICTASQWIGFYMILISVMKDLKCFNYVFSQSRQQLEQSRIWRRLVPHMVRYFIELYSNLEYI